MAGIAGNVMNHSGDCGLLDPSGDFVVKTAPGQEVSSHSHLSKDPHGLGLEIVCVKLPKPPTQAVLSKIYSERRKGINPVIVYAQTETQAWLFGPNPESPALNPLCLFSNHEQIQLRTTTNPYFTLRLAPNPLNRVSSHYPLLHPPTNSFWYRIGTELVRNICRPQTLS